MVKEGRSGQEITGKGFDTGGLLGKAGVQDPTSPLYDPSLSMIPQIAGSVSESIVGMLSSAKMGKTLVGPEWKKNMDLVENISLASLAGRSYMQDFNENIEKGVSLSQAQTSAITTGLFEAGTEFLPMDLILKRNAKTWIN